MAVYARGYRPYRGTGVGAPAWHVIYREGYRLAFKNLGFRIIGLLFVAWFLIWAAFLYFKFGVGDQAERLSQGAVDPFSDAEELKQTLAIFYSGISVLTGLLAILIGSGLISDDLRARALSLYLVRPIRAWEYVLGKALVLPRILVWTCVLPGACFYLLVGTWQPPGTTLTWLRENTDILIGVGYHFLIAAGSYTGLMLFLSARTDRRGAVISIAAAILFAGSLLSLTLSRIPEFGAYAKYAGLPVNAACPLVRQSVEVAVTERRGAATAARVLDAIPEPGWALALGGALLALGLLTALRRARTVEVSA